MSLEFGQVLQGLMDNRGLSLRDVSVASLRSRATILLLLNGTNPPEVELLQDIAPVLGMQVADLLVIAGLPAASEPHRPAIYRAPTAVADLVMAAGALDAEQVHHLIDLAHSHSERKGGGA